MRSCPLSLVLSALQRTGLFGNFQVDNAACALTAFNVLSEIEGIKIDRRKAGEALEKTRWPGRFEKIQEDPLIGSLINFFIKNSVRIFVFSNITFD